MGGLDATKLVIKRVQVNRAPKTRRRTYRAHGRIGKYEGSPAHIELEVEEMGAQVEKAADAAQPRLTAKRAAQLRITAGGGAASANLNQKRMAVCAALAASALPSLVMARGHNIDN